MQFREGGGPHPGGAQGNRAVQVSRFGVISKKIPGKWRLIIDLLAPRYRSVNDGINEDLAYLAYVSVDNMVEVITALGGEVFMGKGDVKEAYHLIPVHPEDRGSWGWCGMETYCLISPSHLVSSRHPRFYGGGRHLSMGAGQQRCIVCFPLCG